MREIQSDKWVKVVVKLSDHWSGNTAERLWAAPTEEGYFTIQNIPVYAYDISLDDVVEAVSLDDGFGIRLVYQRVVMPSGHRTIRLVFDQATPDERAAICRLLNDLSLFFESTPGGLYGFDVPPSADLSRVVDLLNGWSEKGILSWELASGDSKSLT